MATEYMSPEQRVSDLEYIQALYADDFLGFLEFCMDKQGFATSEMQKDIAEYICDISEGNYKMVQAPRGEAKTTITSIYALWRLVCTPTIKIYVVTANKSLAGDITMFMYDAVTKWDEFKCLAPESDGRQSTEKFDVWSGFLPVRKEPSVQCNGIMSGHAGKRADLIICDDIEDEKNAETVTAREKLLSKFDGLPDLANKGGDILVLGTPQDHDSIYNQLPGKGYQVRIWTGRIPKREEIGNYEGKLAPYILDLIDNAVQEDYSYGMDMNLGRATDPLLNSEYALLKKETQNKSRFRMQYMLDTTLSDLDKFPIKLDKLLFTNINVEAGLPSMIHTTKAHSALVPVPANYSIRTPMYVADSITGDYIPITNIYMAVDPAGGGINGDETGYAIAGQSGDRIVLLDVGGAKGGYDDECYSALTAVLNKWQPTSILVEKNYGHGSFRKIWDNYNIINSLPTLNIEDVYNTGQKEKRICDVLEPVINTKKLIVDLDVIENEWSSAMSRDRDDKKTYSLITQMASITREHDCLGHDDRIDALSMVIAKLSDALYNDTNAIESAQKELNDQQWFCQTYGYGSWSDYIQDAGTQAPGYEMHLAKIETALIESTSQHDPFMDILTKEDNSTLIGMII